LLEDFIQGAEATSMQAPLEVAGAFIVEAIKAVSVSITLVVMVVVVSMEDLLLDLEEVMVEDMVAIKAAVVAAMLRITTIIDLLQAGLMMRDANYLSATYASSLPRLTSSSFHTPQVGKILRMLLPQLGPSFALTFS
jgi:hypothetical protein